MSRSSYYQMNLIRLSVRFLYNKLGIVYACNLEVIMDNYYFEHFIAECMKVPFQMYLVLLGVLTSWYYPCVITRVGNKIFASCKLKTLAKTHSRIRYHTDYLHTCMPLTCCLGQMKTLAKLQSKSQGLARLSWYKNSRFTFFFFVLVSMI